MRQRIASVTFLVLVTMPLGAAAISAAPIGDPAFQHTWERADRAVTEGVAVRSWLWGPEAYSGVRTEPYAESPGGLRQVQYFDKSRMEITIPGADQSSQWYVTNGLLARELISGNRQTGNNSYIPQQPADVGVAGDPDDVTGPTYATFGYVSQQPSRPIGSVITDQLSRDGSFSAQPQYATHGVTAAHYEELTGYTTASVFESFIHAQGTIYENGSYTIGIVAGVFAVGLPITEAFWTEVKVAGSVKSVLVQCFERRCLTYTPSNDPAWRVEMGNIGQHYYRWLYGSDPPPPPLTFGDGTYLIGSDIPAGTYRNDDSSGGCYWERLSGFSGELSDIIANEFTTVRTIVTIDAGDAGFSTDDCGTWTNDLSPVTVNPDATFGPGTFIVGVDISPGTWRNSDSSDSCYWERLSGFGGTLSHIIANEFSDTLQIVTISPTDIGFHSSRCGTWTKIG